MGAAESTTREAEELLSTMEGARRETLALVADVSDADMNRVIDPLMSPLSWDLGHIAAYEDLWLAHRCGGEELLEPDLASLYDAFETPRAVRGDIAALDAIEAVDYLARVRERTRELAARAGAEPRDYWEVVLRHELQHRETMRQTLDLGGLLPAGEPALGANPAALEWLAVDGGAFTMGAGADGFAYDNERPAHQAAVAAFQIASRPASNAEWLRFAADGGYERRELWSDEGWQWREQEGGRPDPGIGAGPADAAACHVSWHEAEAFACYREARLPSEAEWEKAARSGDGRWGALGSAGQVWEWTASTFDGYPGFVAYPYREYSEVFFGKRIPRAAWRELGDRRARREPDVPQLGPSEPPPDLRRRASGRERVMEQAQITIESHLTTRRPRTLADDVRDGLTRPFKELPPKHFYDARGAELFDLICELPEYYPTRTERAILERRADEIAAATGAAELVELGAGTASKTRVLIDALLRAGTLRPLRADRRHRVRRSFDGRGARARVPRTAGPRRDRRLRAPPGPPAAGRRAAARRLPRRDHRQLHAARQPRVPARARGTASPARTTC